MVVNPATTTRKLVSLSNDLIAAIENFRFQNRIKTESEAIRRLIERGLSAPVIEPGGLQTTVSRTMRRPPKSTAK